MVLSNGLGDVKQEQQYVLTSMCRPPGGKPLASVLEHGYVARDCSGGVPEMRIWPVQATGLTATFHPTMGEFILRFGFLVKKIMHLWQRPWQSPSALKPNSTSHLYFSFPLPSGSSPLLRLLIMRGKPWRVRPNSWETAQIVVGHDLFRLESCHLSNLSASRLLLQARALNVFRYLRTILFGSPSKYSLSLRSFQYPCGTTRSHLEKSSSSLQQLFGSFQEGKLQHLITTAEV